nr:thermostable hemolysin [uncultured Duganella sp.]
MIDTIAALPSGAAGAAGPGAGVPAARPRREPPFAIERFGPGQPGRRELEAFIAASFLASYGAEVSHFCDVLLGCRDGDGRWIAALGYTLAADGPVFLEQYLDAPIETALGGRAGAAVARADIVEVGNLASTHPGAARALIVSTTRHLHGLGLRWVAFTATVSLLNSFSRLRLQPQVLAAADPARLADAGRRWGSYYDTQPKVMFGDIRYGYAQLT